MDGSEVNGLLIASSALERVPASLFLDRPWCLLDDGAAVRAASLRGSFAGTVLAPADRELSSTVSRCVGEALTLLGRRRDVNLEARAIASMEAGVLGADRTGCVRFANGAYVRLLCGPPIDPVGRLLQDLLHPTGDATSVEAFDRAIRGEAPFNGEVRLAGAPESTAFAAGIGTIRGETDAEIGLVVTIHDLSERRAIEDSLRAAHTMLERRAWTDPLTGLANRSFFDDALERELARARRHGTKAAVLLVDLDDFKDVNDEHGHDVGDEVLAAVSGSLRVGLREGDVLARYGGDEFCVLLADTDAATARAVAERVRASVAALRSGPTGAIRITTSIGLATTADLEAGAGARALVRLADRAMYEAKHVGGDRVATSARADAGPAAESTGREAKKPGRHRSRP